MRSKLIAHNELSFEVGRYELFKISVLKLKYGDERKLLEQAKEIINDLNSIVRNTSFLWDSFIEPEKRNVCAFWEIEGTEAGKGTD